jgi:two-component system, NarL family, invasion response regulator UvrY
MMFWDLYIHFFRPYNDDDDLIMAECQNTFNHFTRRSKGMITLLLVDDHDLVRLGIKRLLSDFPDIKVIGEANSGEQAVALAKELKPDVVLMDVKMPGIGGLEATHRILRTMPQIKVVVITSYNEEPFPSRLLQAGATGYLTKGASIQEVVQAIRIVYRGERYLSPEIAQQLAFRHFADKATNPFESLSERELQILLMITSGAKILDIADKLCLSPKTVNSHRYKLYEKLGVATDVELTHLAIRHGLLSELNPESTDT